MAKYTILIWIPVRSDDHFGFIIYSAFMTHSASFFFFFNINDTFSKMFEEIPEVILKTNTIVISEETSAKITDESLQKSLKTTFLWIPRMCLVNLGLVNLMLHAEMLQHITFILSNRSPKKKFEESLIHQTFKHQNFKKITWYKT